MSYYEAARNASEAGRTGVAQGTSAAGDISHLHAIKRLLAGMDEGVDYSNPGNKLVINHLRQGYKNIDKAYEHHDKGDGTAASSYATLAAHHATEAGRCLAPTSLEDAQDNYDPYVLSAASGGAQQHSNDFIKTVNEGK